MQSANIQLQSVNMQSADRTDPRPLPCSPCPDFQWASSDDKAICASAAAYDKAIHWKCNIFLLPSGMLHGKLFIQEMTRILNAFADSSTMESVALKASSACDAKVAFTKKKKQNK